MYESLLRDGNAVKISFWQHPVILFYPLAPFMHLHTINFEI